MARTLLAESVRPMRSKRNRRYGFTLIEVMVVVCIIAILASLAVYGVGKYVRAAGTSEPMEIINSVRAAQESYKDETYGYLPVSTMSSYFPFGTTLPSNKKWSWDNGNSTELKAWNQLGVHPSSVVAFGYACEAKNDNSSVLNKGQMGISQDLGYPANAQNWYIVRAASDRDGNGVAAIFIGSNFTDQIYGQNDTE
jgi:prepilin-type N-terminal cleavage/methylation domain-containing protein